MTIENNKEMVPFEHYLGLFANINTEEASARTGVKFDREKGCFEMRLLYEDYRLYWPEYRIESDNPAAFALKNIPAQILLIRHLLEGCASKGSGNFLTYREMPWGEVYIKPFTGRCLMRAAFTFGTRIKAFEGALEKMPVVMMKNGDVSCQLEIMPGYEVRFIVWEGDEEFPPNVQILYSDNFPQSFSAEDRCVVIDIAISVIKSKM